MRVHFHIRPDLFRRDGLSAATVWLRVPSSQFEHRFDGEDQSFDVSVPEVGLGRAVDLRIQAEFRHRYHRVSVHAKVYKPQYLFLEQAEVNFIRGFIEHERYGSLGAAIVPNCRVSCPASKQSRTGPGVCIECKTKYGRIELCC